VFWANDGAVMHPHYSSEFFRILHNKVFLELIILRINLPLVGCSQAKWAVRTAILAGAIPWVNYQPMMPGLIPKC
jgi:hypothetical protein